MGLTKQPKFTPKKTKGLEGLIHKQIQEESFML